MLTRHSDQTEMARVNYSIVMKNAMCLYNFLVLIELSLGLGKDVCLADDFF